MPRCEYCSVSFETTDQFLTHLLESHEYDELNAVDQRWLDHYADAVDESDTVEDEEPGRALDRRSVMTLAGAGALGIAGVTVGIAQQSGLSSSDLPGMGTESNPTEISNFDELLTIDDDLEANYVLVADIDASEEEPIEPLAPESGPSFTGTLDGQGHEIVGLEIDGVGFYDSAGLFRTLGSGGRVESLHLTDVKATGEEQIGGIAAQNSGGTIEGCSVEGTITSTDPEFSVSNAGVIVGFNLGNGTVRSSFARGTVDAEGNQAGGLVGRNFGTIEECGAAVTVDSETDQVGGLVGGQIATGSISDSYSISNVGSSGDDIGGLVGTNGDGDFDASTIERTYAAGSVDGDDNVGGLAGRNWDQATVSSSYWDELATDQQDAIGQDDGTVDDVTGFDSNDGAGRADEMTGSDAESNMDAFTFGGTWVAVEAGSAIDDVVPEEDGYPILSSADTTAQLEAQDIEFSEAQVGITIEAEDVTIENTTVKNSDHE